MSNATVSIGFKLESGDNGIQKLTLNTKDLKTVLGATATEAKKTPRQESYLFRKATPAP